MKIRTGMLLAIMHVVAWVTFIGLLIEAGSMLVSYGISLFHHQAARDLYQGWDLYNLQQSNWGYYTTAVAGAVALTVLKAYIAIIIVKVLAAVKLSSPFTMEIARRIEKISYIILVTWVATLLYNAYMHWLPGITFGPQSGVVSGETLFLACVIFIIAQIFKKGVEIQSENDLTI